jgi:hypothetical protein
MIEYNCKSIKKIFKIIWNIFSIVWWACVLISLLSVLSGGCALNDGLQIIEIPLWQIISIEIAVCGAFIYVPISIIIHNKKIDKECS